jgi:hypothetical protein
MTKTFPLSLEVGSTETERDFHYPKNFGGVEGKKKENFSVFPI